MRGEPWVHLEDGKTLANWGREDEIAYNQTNRQIHKHRFYRNAFDFLTDNRISGDYLEFGCHRARTFRMALTEARKHNLSSMKFWAFDSFEGLPAHNEHPAIPAWVPGALKTSVEEFGALILAHGIYLENVIGVQGFYTDTLTSERQKAFEESGITAALITVDCDLYESAVPVFNFIDHLLQAGTVLYLDDQFAGFRGDPDKGVAKAFAEYQAWSPWRFIPHLHVGWGGRSYIAHPK